MKKKLFLTIIVFNLLSCVSNFGELEQKTNIEVFQRRSSILDFDNSCSLNLNLTIGDCYSPVTLIDSLAINGCYYKYTYRVRRCLVKTVPLTYLFQVEPYSFTIINGDICQSVMTQLTFLLTTNQYEKVKEFLDNVDNLITGNIENNFTQIIDSEFQQILPECSDSLSPVIETEFVKETCFYWNIIDNLPQKTKCGRSCCIKLFKYCLNEESQIVKKDLGSSEIGSCNNEIKCKVICK